MADDPPRLRIVPRPSGPPPPPARTGPPPLVARRRATIVVAELPATPGAVLEEAAAHTLAALDDLATIVAGHGGRVVDRVDAMLVAAFGAPAAIERAAHQAVTAAAAMRAVPGIRVGVESGVVLVGDPDEASGPGAPVTSDAVGIARRLKDAAAPGRVLVGTRAHDEVAEAFRFEPAADVRGPEDTVLAAWALAAPTPRTGRPTEAPFVGRARELEVLRACVRGLPEDGGGWVDVVGDAGIGKSRLVREMAAACEREGTRVLEGRCTAVGRRTGFLPFVELLRRWAGIDERDTDEHAVASLARALEPVARSETAALLPFLATLMGLPLPSAAPAPEDDALGRIVARSLRRFFELLAWQAPTVVVLEDVHWADGSSIELLASVVGLARALPLLFVCTRRPEPDETTHPLPPARRRIPLQALDPPDADRLVRSLLGTQVATTVAARVVSRTGGNPFFIEQVTRGLDRADASAIPETVEQLLLARAETLAPAARRALEVAAVIGPTVEQRILLRVLGAGVDGDAVIGELVARGFLRPTTRDGDPGYAFPHALAQEAVYAAILRARRIALHAEVADAIVASSGDRLAERYGMLAYHYGRAERVAEAEQYLVAAGEQAIHTAASDAALYYFEEAMRLYLLRHGEGGDPARKAALLTRVGHALFGRGRLLEASETFNRALECLGEHVSRGRARTLLRLPGTAAVVLWQLFSPLRRASGRPASAHDREVFDLMFHRQEAQITADPQRLVVDCLENLRRFGTVDPSTVPRAGGLYAGAGGLFGYGGISFAIGQRLLTRAAAFVDHADPRELLRVEATQYIHHVLAGDWHLAREVDDALVAENVRLGRLWEATTYLGVLTERRIHEGRFADGEAGIARLAAIERDFDFELAKSNRQAMTALLHLERGRLVAALDAASAYLADHRDDLLNIYALGILAKIRVESGDVAAAATDVARAGEIVRRVAVVPPFHRSRYARSRLLLGVARHAHDRGAERAALRAARWVAWSRPEALRLAGASSWLGGRRRRAVVLWERGIREATRLGLRPELARLYREAGTLLAEANGSPLRVGGDDARACLAHAVALFGELGVEPADVSR
ncbi:MAG TPA: AAA family ATPase [Candidatus Eisenbacteria bacterium]|nr:AAA family ATPase [Candidatus Eisenbacteria bacterium]